MTQAILVFTYGNPSRGDDAIGPAVYEQLLAEPLPDTEVLTDFQLQIEHTQDLIGRKAVIFVDASLSGKSPYAFYPIQADKDYSYTTHAMSPETILSVYEQVNEQPLPAAFMLSVRGYEFELGHPLSVAAQQAMQQAVNFLRKIVQVPTSEWLYELNDPV